MSGSESTVTSATIQGVFQDAVSDGANAAADALSNLNATVDSTTTKTTRGVATMASLRKQLDDNAAATNAIAAATAKYEAQINSLNVQLERGKTTQAEVDTLSAAAAAQRDAALAKVNGTTVVSTSATNDNVAAQKAAIQAATGLTSQHTALGGATAGATREFLVLGHEIVSGNYSRIPGSMIVLAERTNALHTALGFLSPLFSGIGLGFAAVGVAAVAGLTIAAVNTEEANRALLGLQTTLQATRSDYMALASQAQSVGRTVNIPGVSTGDATAAAAIIESTKNYAANDQQLKNLLIDTEALSKVMGVDLTAAAKTVASAINDPGAAAKKAAEEGFVGFNATVVNSIKNMADAGDKAGAFTQYMQALNPSIQGVTSRLTPLQDAMYKLDSVFKSADGSGKGLGATLGTAVTTAAEVAITAIRGVLEEIRDVYNYVKSIATSNMSSKPDANAGTPTLGTPIPMSGGGYQQATGIMQVLPSTAKLYGYSQSDISSSTEANIYAGVTDLVAKLKQNLGDLNAALGAYGGASSAAGVAAYNAKVSAANPSSLDPSVLSLIHNASLYAGQQRGLTADQESLIEATMAKVAVVESGGHQFATPAQLALQNGYQNGISGNIDSTMNGAIKPIPVTIASSTGDAPSPYGIVNASLINDAENRALSIGGLTSSREQNAADQSILSKAIPQVTTNTALAGMSGMDGPATADQLASAAQTDQVKKLGEALDITKGRATDLITEQQKLARSATDAVAPLSAQEGATRDLAVIQQQFTEAARKAGTGVDQASLLQAQHDKLVQLASAYQDTITQTDLQTASQNRINASFDSGAASVIAATNHEKALAAARKDFLPGPDQDAAVVKYAAALDAASAAAADLNTKQKGFQQQNDIAVLTQETQSLGENADQRTKEIALLQEKQALIAKGVDVDSAASKADLANVANIQDMTAALRSQNDAMSELSNFAQSTFSTIGNSIVQAFTTGGAAAIDFGSIAKAALASVLEEVLKLAVLNPILNNLFGQNNTTLSTVGGAIGNLLGNNSSSSWGDATQDGTAAVASGGGLLASAGKLLGIGGGTSASGGYTSFDNATADGTGTLAAGSGSGGVLGSGISGSTLLAGVGLLSGLASLAQGKGVSVSQGLGLAAGAYQVGSSLLTSAGTTAAANAAATAAATSSLGAGASAGAIANAAGGIGGAGSLLGNVGFSTSTGTFSGITTFINGAAEKIAEGVVGAVNSVTGAVGSVATEVGTSLGIIADSTAAGTAAITAGASGAAAAGTGATAAGTAATSAVSTVAGYLPYIGAAISVVTDLAQGNYRGAGFVAGGAAIGAAVYGPIGAAVGAAVGALADAFLPNHPKNPYQATEVDASNGQLSVGDTVSQLDDPTQAISATQDWVTNVNAYLTQLHLAVTNNGKIGSVGQGIDGYTQVTDPSLLLPSLRFTSTETDDNLGKTEAGDLPGHSFATPQDLANQLTLEDQFATRMDALGLQLQAIGVDFKTISVAAVQQVSRADSATIPTGTDLAASDPTSSAWKDLLSDFRTALSHDLPNQIFADETALDTEIDKVYTFVAQTMPSLINPVLVAAESDLQKGVDSIALSYQQAEAQAQAYGLSVDAIASGMWTAINEYMAPAIKTLDQADQSINARGLAATGNQEGADLENYDVQAAQELDAYKKSLTDVFGNAYATTAEFGVRVANLETVQGEERLAIVQKYGDAASASLTSAIGSVSTYLNGLETSPLSPASTKDQADAALLALEKANFAASTGDQAALASVPGYADTALKTNQAVYGDGAEYVNFFQSVVSAISSSVASIGSDQLTASVLQATSQAATTALVAAMNAVQASVDSLRAEVKQGSAAPARISA